MAGPIDDIPQREPTEAPEAIGASSRETDALRAQPIDQPSPLREMLRIAAPSVVTMTSYTIMQFIDGMMVSRIQPPDAVYVSAQGNGGMAVWLALSVLLGLFTIVNSFVSQHLGAGTPQRGAAYAWATIWLSVGYALVLILYALALPMIFASMHHDGQLLELEVGYGQILTLGAFCTLASRGVANYFYGMHMAGVVMIAALLGNLANLSANTLLIFGDAGLATTGLAPIDTIASGIAQLAGSLGIEGMGVRGAALGTVIGTSVELVLPVAVFLGPRLNRRYATRAAWKPSLAPIRAITRAGWPGAAMFANEMVCWAYLMAVLLPKAGAAAGDSPVVHNTAGWIALRYMHVSFMPTVGLSIGVTAIVGKAMGMGRPDLAAHRAWLGLRLALVYMGLCALGFVLFRRSLIGVFVPQGMPPEQVDQLVSVGASIMIAAAVFQLFDAVAITMSGALRGAGDVVWPGVVTLILAWGCIIAGGEAMIALAPELGSLGPWIAASAYIVLLGLFLLVRFMRGRWKSISLIEPASGQTNTDPAAGGPNPGGAAAEPACLDGPGEGS